MRRARRFFLHTAALTATNLLMRSIAMAFQVYVAGKIGAAGIGLFQLITSIYLMAVTVASSGIRLAATRLVAEQEGCRNNSGIVRSLRCCTLYAAVFGLAALLLLFFLAPVAAESWTGDAGAVLSFRILAFSLPFVACSSAFSGYFMARRQSVRVSTVQLLEQFVRIGSTVFALSSISHGSIQQSCAALTLGMTISEAFSFSVLLVFVIGDIKKLRKSGKPIPVLRPLLTITLPISLSSYARSALSTLQHVFIPRGLQQYGGGREEALASYGVIQGMSLPVLLFPSALIAVIADLIVPELTEAQVKGHLRNLAYMLERLYRLGLIFAIGVGGLCFYFAEPLGMMIYQNADACRYIRILSPLVPAMYMDTLVDGMLKGVGEYNANMRYNIIDAGVGLALVCLLIPRLGIAGYVFSIAATELLNFALSARRITHVTEFRMHLLDWVRNILCFFAACTAAKLLFRGLLTRYSTVPGLILGILLILILYLLLLVLARAVTGSDLKWLFSLLRNSKSDEKQN